MRDEGVAGAVAVVTSAEEKHGKKAPETSRPSRSPTSLGRPDAKAPASNQAQRQGEQAWDAKKEACGRDSPQDGVRQRGEIPLPS